MLKAEVLVKLPARKAYNYPIFINSGIIDNICEYLSKVASCGKIVLICDETVRGLYALALQNKLKMSSYDVLLLSFASGEQSKNYANFEYLLNEMLKFKCDRHSLCIAIGGGVVGDMTGFVASVFMRGIRYIQIPTTLLAMIDSSVGGKTAINSVYGKNLIGAFSQPSMVIMDTSFLNTLPQEQLINGLVEAIKIFLTCDAKFTEYTIDNLDKILNRNYVNLRRVIKRAVQLKSEVVAKDEKEENLRMILNFGHTVGHALEKLSNYTIPHGYAVALGILVEAKIAVLLGVFDQNQYLLILSLFMRLSIPIAKISQYSTDDIIREMQGDKKNKSGHIYIVLLSDIGRVDLDPNGKVTRMVKENIIQNALATFNV